MFALVGSLIGFVGSVLPDIFKVYQDKLDKKHELALLDKQLQADASEHMYKMEAIGVKADIAEMKALYGTYHSGIKWVDALNATVRPVLAYSFFLLYFVIKLCMIVQSTDMGVPLADSVLGVWGVEDQAIFAGIISFYFGKRQMDRVMRRG